MTTAALRVRRARFAIYGPPVVAIVGGALIAVGIVGLALNRETTTRDAVVGPSTVTLPRGNTHVVPSAGAFALLSADGALYTPADPELGQPTVTSKAGTVVGGATAVDGSVWLVTDRGQVIGVHAPVLGSMLLRPGDAPVVGMARRRERSWLPDRRPPTVTCTRSERPSAPASPASSSTAPVVGIAPAAHDGYWIALARRPRVRGQCARSRKHRADEARGAGRCDRGVARRAGLPTRDGRRARVRVRAPGAGQFRRSHLRVSGRRAGRGAERRVLARDRRRQRLRVRSARTRDPGAHNGRVVAIIPN